MGSATKLRLLDVLSSVSRDLVEALDADACGISRAIGDMLILVVEHSEEGKTIQLGQGYLVSDYPETARVLADRTPHALTLDDPGVDEPEAAILRELEFGSLLMLPLILSGEVWGLVEIYRASTRGFSDADARTAQGLLQRAF
ncbi:MAG TPA: GAF domain-containing protein [Gaiellaceae bacterium]|nr:GAF domain-containing protein [Gaiellaceae bacterium]